MEYVQERVTTLHDFTDPTPDAPTDRAAVVVPMTEREHNSLAAERVLTALERVAPERVVVALRAPAERVGPMCDWLEGFDLPLEPLWCDGPALDALLSEACLNGHRGKGRDVWLALGVAAKSDFVAVHDADAKTYSERHVPRLLFPLDHGYDFAKGYYARVENNRLYGRLFRLFYAPLVRALADAHDAPVLDYLDSFRYALAGEFAGTSDLVRSLRIQRGWGLEVGTLGDAFAAAGFDGTAQVDLGKHEHDHRAVSGAAGLSTMAEQVGDALFRAVESGGVTPAYDTLQDRYRETARGLIRQYAADAAFNGLDYDRAGERDQVDAYASAVSSPSTDTRLPAWADAPVAVEAVREAAREDVAEAR
ncbi:glycosyl transferase family 2 [Natronomonas sp. EA1]|uniref:glycosyl transferase family 2 n=1 Tax=Natronomonas sp. EA1 TaxID=3421655 RepID=UPI003EBCF66C